MVPRTARSLVVPPALGDSLTQRSEPPTLGVGLPAAGLSTQLGRDDRLRRSSGVREGLMELAQDMTSLRVDPAGRERFVATGVQQTTPENEQA